MSWLNDVATQQMLMSNAIGAGIAILVSSFVGWLFYKKAKKNLDTQLNTLGRFIVIMANMLGVEDGLNFDAEGRPIGIVHRPKAEAKGTASANAKGSVKRKNEDEDEEDEDNDDNPG